MIRVLFFFLYFAGCSLSLTAGKDPVYTARILLIPLDDRPPCLQFTQRMAMIGNAEIVTPPLAGPLHHARSVRQAIHLAATTEVELI